MGSNAASENPSSRRHASPSVADDDASDFAAERSVIQPSPPERSAASSARNAASSSTRASFAVVRIAGAASIDASGAKGDGASSSAPSRSPGRHTARCLASWRLSAASSASARARASASAASVAAPTPAPIPVVSPTALDATGSDPEAAVARGPAVEIAAETAPDASAAIASSSFDASAAVFSPPTIAIAAVSATIRRNAVSSARSSASSAAAARLAAAYPAAPDAALAAAVAATPTTLFAHACNPCATIAAAWDTVAPCVRNTTGVIDATMGDATPAPAPKRCAAAMTAAAKTATTAARGANALAANPVVVVVVVVANATLRAARGLEPLHAPARVSRSPFGSDSVSSGVVRADSSSPTRGIWMSAHSGMVGSPGTGFHRVSCGVAADLVFLK